jgi:hypothetical protein
MGLHHQRPARLLLCLGSLETRKTKQRWCLTMHGREPDHCAMIATHAPRG